MGYAGYVPAKYAPPPPTDLQAALWKVASLEALEIISTVSRNIAVNPTEGKYRKLRLSNVKIHQNIVAIPGALEALQLMGWELDSSEADSLIFPTGRQLTMAQVRVVDEAKDRLKRIHKDAARKKASAKLPTTDAQARVRAQMEADRLERLAKGPVVVGSVAQPLPSNNAGITTARDIGIGAEEHDHEHDHE
ncbi:hypothetical protein WJX73_008153 [Symbiochloris irregularis]|uniref:PUB domain-containing protein n=1 Tax=Symbiochloris irregularis TaxID=706552 RepID=A0AAW1PQB5_9CHLO